VGGRVIYTGSTEDVVDFVVNPAVASSIPADLLTAIDEARDAIRSGALEVPRVPFVEGEPDGR
jgi:hypothetical protein